MTPARTRAISSQSAPLNEKVINTGPNSPGSQLSLVSGRWARPHAENPLMNGYYFEDFYPLSWFSSWFSFVLRYFLSPPDPNYSSAPYLMTLLNFFYVACILCLEKWNTELKDYDFANWNHHWVRGVFSVVFFNNGCNYVPTNWKLYLFFLFFKFGYLI